MTTNIITDIDLAASLLMNNDVIAIPTETVYGLAGNALEEVAVRKIYQVKERPLSNPLIVHIAGVSQLELYAIDIPPAARQLAEHFWPGPLTMVLQKHPSVPDLVTSGSPRVAIRIPNHPVALQLLRKLPFPLAAPSANPFGYISPTTAKDVQRMLNGKIPAVLEGGPCAKGIESTIIGFEGNTPVIYRLGVITPDEIIAVAGAVEFRNKQTQAPVAPGMFPSHYAPHTPLVLTDRVSDFIDPSTSAQTAVLAFKEYCKEVPQENQALLSAAGDLHEAAANLYKHLHYLDGLNCKTIIAERVPNEGIGQAINDRLKKAAYR